MPASPRAPEGVFMTNDSEAKRLEGLWSGGFGNAYVDRNRGAGAPREDFWRSIIAATKPRRVLEVGCNVGGNLRWIAGPVPATSVFGIDINPKALDEARSAIPGLATACCPARDLPFRDRWFDLAFTMGVLIHQPNATLPLVMGEIVRCSARWVLCGEYHSDHEVEVPYRGETGALFKRDYGRLYRELFPELTLRDSGFLGKDKGWDDVTWCLLERT